MCGEPIGHSDRSPQSCDRNVWPHARGPSLLLFSAYSNTAGIASRGRISNKASGCSYNPHRSGEWDERDPNRPNRFGNLQTSFGGDTEETFDPASVVVPSFVPDIPAVRSELAQYYQSIARLDRGVGRLLQILKEEGRYDRTVVVYISDNGAAFPQAKTTLYDPGMRLPCLVRAPGMRRRGVAVEAPVSWVDLTPTFLDYEGCGSRRGPFMAVYTISNAIPTRWKIWPIARSMPRWSSL